MPPKLSVFPFDELSFPIFTDTSYHKVPLLSTIKIWCPIRLSGSNLSQYFSMFKVHESASMVSSVRGQANAMRSNLF